MATVAQLAKARFSSFVRRHSRNTPIGRELAKYANPRYPGEVYKRLQIQRHRNQRAFLRGVDVFV